MLHLKKKMLGKIQQEIIEISKQRPISAREITEIYGDIKKAKHTIFVLKEVHKLIKIQKISNMSIWYVYKK